MGAGWNNIGFVFAEGLENMMEGVLAPLAIGFGLPQLFGALFVGGIIALVVRWVRK